VEENQAELPEYPIEYQVFALSLKNPGSIAYFDAQLPEDMVGIVNNQIGINEFYKALLSYYRTTKLDLVDPIAFKAWLESETNIHSGLGGAVGVNAMIDILACKHLITNQ